MCYLSDEIQAYFGDGSDFGVSLNYTIESTPLGTAGSVKLAEKFLKDDTFLIVSGDSLTDCDLTKAIEFHKARKSMATLILCHVSNPLEYGVVITDEENKVVRFQEKPSWSEVFSDTVNTGMYILEPEIFDYMELEKPYDWSGDIFPKLLEDGKPIYGYVMDGYWCDIGSLPQYREAQEHFLSGRVDLPLSDEVNESESSGVFIGPNCNVDETASLVPPVFIGRNCHVKKGARIGPYSILGDNAYIEEKATIDRSILWDNTYVGHSAALHSTIIGSRAIIKRDCVLREDSVIGDRCLIDVGSNVRPRIKIWPDKIVERGSTVTMSLVWGNKWHGNLFRDLGVAGLSNIEITPDFACRLGSSYGSCFPPHTKIVTSRDSTRSSRMIKRAISASLLSSGCTVLDLHSMALPIARHYIHASSASGAIHVRKLPDNSRVTLVELLDSRGVYLPKNLERKVENSFYREDYRRADAEAIGQIEFASNAVEQYQREFFQLLESAGTARTKLNVVCDYGYSSMASYFPAMLARLGIETMSLSGFDDGKRAPRTEQEVDVHLTNLQRIVKDVGYDIGVLFTSDGERLTLVDSEAEIVGGHRLLATIAVLLANVQPNAKVAMSVTAPSKLENLLVSRGCEVVRTKVDVRSLMETALEQKVTFAGDERGGFIFPEMQNCFDAPYCFGKLITLLRQANLGLHEVVESLPSFHLGYENVRVDWEDKGAIMRQLAESCDGNARVELTDGIKIYNDKSWALILPDAIEPMVHIYSESEEDSHCHQIANDYVAKIAAIQSTL